MICKETIASKPYITMKACIMLRYINMLHVTFKNIHDVNIYQEIQLDDASNHIVTPTLGLVEHSQVYIFIPNFQQKTKKKKHNCPIEYS